MRTISLHKPLLSSAIRVCSVLAVVATTAAAQAQSGTVVKRLGGGLLGGDQVTIGVAVDASGNVYVADRNQNAVKEIPPGCTSAACTITLGAGFNGPEGVAVDGNGNVYVADTMNEAVKEMPAGCASASCVTTLISGLGASGIAVDGSGNVYVSAAYVEEIPVGCVSLACVVSLGGYLPAAPFGVAVDGSGNVYFVASGRALEMPPGCTSSSCVTTLDVAAQPTGIAVDGSGNVFVSEGSYVEPPTGTVFARPSSCPAGYRCKTFVAGTFHDPWGIAVDQDGNVYVPDSSDGTIHELVGAGLIFGTIGQPVDATTQYMEITPGDDVLITGWAAYPHPSRAAR